MKNITLRKIKYYTALVKYKNFGLAADAAAISQPALSMQIKELESEVGAPLIERGTSRLILTKLGRDFHLKCLEVLEKVEDLTTITKIAKQQMLEQLSVGIIPTIAPYLLPDLIVKTEEVFPGLSLIFKESQTENLLSEMREGNLDCCILALPVSEAGFQKKHLFDENFLLVRNAKQIGSKVPAPSSLLQHKLLLLEEGHCFRDQAISFCGIATDFNTQQHDASSFTTLVHMVSAGLGITLIPEMAQKIETSGKDVIVDRFNDPQPKRSIGMIWRSSSSIENELKKIHKVWKNNLKN